MHTTIIYAVSCSWHLVIQNFEYLCVSGWRVPHVFIKPYTNGGATDSYAVDGFTNRTMDYAARDSRLGGGEGHIDVGPSFKGWRAMRLS
jgi:hypothetical protein